MAMVLKQKGAIQDMNVTPLIDVLLVLLIIFMVITPNQPVGLQATIPQQSSDQANAGAPDRTIVVQIDKDLAVTINSEPTDMARLGDRLAMIFKSRAERVVFVRADPDVEFRHVARAIDIAKGASVDRIGLLGNRF
jgi:biopolymer transport protein TolR